LWQKNPKVAGKLKPVWIQFKKVEAKYDPTRIPGAGAGSGVADLAVGDTADLATRLRKLEFQLQAALKVL
jgi:hypothetical protein